MTETLPRAIQVLPAGGWVERTARHRVTLDFDDRFRRRKRYVAEDGFAFLLDLEEATVLRQGDGLLLEGGGVILVQAAPEPLIEVTAETPERGRDRRPGGAEEVGHLARCLRQLRPRVEHVLKKGQNGRDGSRRGAGGGRRRLCQVSGWCVLCWGRGCGQDGGVGGPGACLGGGLCPQVRRQHNRGRVAAGPPCQAEPVAGGGVHQRLTRHVHQELVGAEEVHPQDGEGDICTEEGPLKGAAAEAQLPPFLPPSPYVGAIGAGEAWLRGRYVHGQ